MQCPFCKITRDPRISTEHGENGFGNVSFEFGICFLCFLVLFEKHKHYLLLIDLKQLAERLMYAIGECFKDILLTMTR